MDLIFPGIFFATSHGKGVVDGLGGVVKHSVWRAVCTGEVVSSAKKFYNVVCIRNPNILLSFISHDDIEKSSEICLNIWNEVKALPQTQSIHCIIPISLYAIKFAQTSNSTSFYTFVIRKSDDCESVTESIGTPTTILNTKYCNWFLGESK